MICQRWTRTIIRKRCNDARSKDLFEKKKKKREKRRKDEEEIDRAHASAFFAAQNSAAGKSRLAATRESAARRINATITSLKRRLINPMFSQLHSLFLTGRNFTMQLLVCARARERNSSACSWLTLLSSLLSFVCHDNSARPRARARAYQREVFPRGRAATRGHYVSTVNDDSIWRMVRAREKCARV